MTNVEQLEDVIRAAMDERNLVLIDKLEHAGGRKCSEKSKQYFIHDLAHELAIRGVKP